MKYLRIKSMDGKEVKKVAVRNESQYERVLSGMLRRIDTDNYFVDDSDFD